MERLHYHTVLLRKIEEKSFDGGHGLYILEEILSLDFGKWFMYLFFCSLPYVG